MVCQHGHVSETPGTPSQPAPEGQATGQDPGQGAGQGAGQPQGKPGRYQRTTGGLIGSMIVLVAAVIGIVLFRGAFRDTPEFEPTSVDYLSEVVRPVQGAGSEIVYPAAVPEGWMVNDVTYTPGEQPVFELALLTPEESFAGLHEEAEDVDDLVEELVDPEAVEGEALATPDSDVATSWQTFTDEGGDTAYVATTGSGDDERTVVVYGSATPEELQELLGELTVETLPERGSGA